MSADDSAASRAPNPHPFSQIRAATRLSTGTIVVLDGASQRLRAFSPDGAHLGLTRDDLDVERIVLLALDRSP